MRGRCLVPTLLAAVVLLRPPATAQVRPLYDQGAAGLTSAIQRLGTTASALHTGAHPDDEDSAFIARTARGDHARVAYLSLNRGEGGQNILGPELFEALGVIRTEELLQARRLDGGEQFFTRAFDFGFSKTRDETAERWNEREVLHDMVRVIRSFRPLVIYSRFSGTSADGHGHHQMAGSLTPLAFDAAADPNQFPELAREGLHPWQALKLYRGLRGGGAGASLPLATGVVDPIIGRSYAEIAAEGRSQHKSQGMGGIEPLGPSSTSLVRERSLVETPPSETSVFDGIDVTLPGLAALAGLPPGALRDELADMSAAAARAIDGYEPLTPGRVLPALAAGLRATRAARAALRTLDAPPDAVAAADALLERKAEEFEAALVLAAGVVVDPLAEAETVEPGAALEVAVRTFLTGASGARVTAAAVRPLEPWRVSAGTGSDGAAGSGGRGFRREQAAHEARFRVDVPADAAATRPYYLQQPRAGDMYIWPDGPARTLPFAPPLLSGVVTLDIAGVEVTVERPVEFRYADPVRGELRRPVAVVPALTIGLDSRLLVVPTGDTARTLRLVVTATSDSRASVSATVHLDLPAGWTAVPSSVPLTLDGGGTQSVAFDVTAPAGRRRGSHRIGVRADAGARTFAEGMQVVAYPHIQTHRLYASAEAAAQVFDLEVAPVRVGYIMGSGDQVPEALRRMGVDVTLLDDQTLARGDLSRFDTIVAGVRAAEARPAFIAHHGRLEQFMERGGALVVQYQQQYASRDVLPYPAQAAGNSRVTREDAPVTILAPQHPVFTFPNRITAADFDGWVQERNLYAFTGFDDRYTPLLESADPGEAPQRGGELYARVGKGHYVYTAYAWFRQLPAGVPGAYRQFANLISLPKAP